MNIEQLVSETYDADDQNVPPRLTGTIPPVTTDRRRAN